MKKLAVIRPAAECDLERHTAYLSDAANLEVAGWFLIAVRDSVERIAELSHIGTQRTFESSRLSGIRMMPVSNFRSFLIFYQSEDELVRIVRIIHAKEDYWRIFGL